MADETTVIPKRKTRQVRLTLSVERADKLRRVATGSGHTMSGLVERFIDTIEASAT